MVSLTRGSHVRAKKPIFGLFVISGLSVPLIQPASGVGYLVA